MQYIIATKHGKKDDTLTKPMSFKEACELFSSITGELITGMVEGEEITVGPCTIRRAALPELILDEEGTLWLDGIVDDFSDTRFKVAYDRAVKEFGGVIGDPESEEFLTEFNSQLKCMAVEDLLEHYVSIGKLAIQRIDNEGRKYYASTEDPENGIVHVQELV